MNFVFMWRYHNLPPVEGWDYVVHACGMHLQLWLVVPVDVPSHTILTQPPSH